ncbi:MAG: NAD(P)-dependent alcohol dehydrogenase [Spirochaetaceae bacterium]
MRAMTIPKYGPPEVLRLQDREKPTPGPGDVLIRVIAASVNAGDWHIVRGEPKVARLALGLFRPEFAAAGMDLAGIVEALGADAGADIAGGATAIKVGAEVIADVSNARSGAFVEYTVVPAKDVGPKPASMSFEEAATLPVAGLTALQGLRDHGKLQAGEKVLITGASGGVGMFAVQIAKAMGARVTGVCSSAKVEMVRSLGADSVVDYKKEDVTKKGETYDVILDAGAFRSIFDYTGTLSPAGRHVMVGGSTKAMFQSLLLGGLRSKKGGKQFVSFICKANREDLAYLSELVDAGKLKTVIGARFPLEAAAKAIRAVEQGIYAGKVVVRVSGSGT